ncbi:MAG: F0F1 ATP synthase subunit delta [Parabacteroides sp.]
MDNGIIATRYARALLEYASSKGAESQVYELADMLVLQLQQEPRLKQALANPAVAVQTKERLLRVASGSTGCPEWERFLQLVIRHHREELLERIGWIYKALYRKAKNINRIEVYSAVPLSPEVNARITREARQQTGGEIELEAFVRPELLGGVSLRMNNYRIDATVTAQLKQLYRQWNGQPTNR